VIAGKQCIMEAASPGSLLVFCTA